MSHEHDVAVVGRGEYRAAAAAISAGHAEYPSFRHLFPDPARRARALRAFFEANGTRRRSRSAPCSRPAMEAGSMQPRCGSHPGAFPWSAWRKLRATPSLARVFLADPRAFPAFARYGGIVERHHRGNDACWYLEVLSVRPESQRRGLGRGCSNRSSSEPTATVCRAASKRPIPPTSPTTSGSASTSTVHRSRSSATVPL